MTLQNIHTHALEAALHMTADCVREADLSRGYPGLRMVLARVGHTWCEECLVDECTSFTRDPFSSTELLQRIP